MALVKETYSQMKRRHQESNNNFKGIGFAFSNEQFTEMCIKLGIEESNSKELLYSIGGGGYILKSVSKDFNQLINNNKNELKEAMKNPDFVYSAFNYELGNHEYIITYEIDDTLDALDITIDEFNNNKMYIEQMQKAKENQCNNSCWG